LLLDFIGIYFYSLAYHGSLFDLFNKTKYCNKQIATKAGVTESMVSSVRGGRYMQVSFEKFITICKVLKIELQINIKQ